MQSDRYDDSAFVEEAVPFVIYDPETRSTDINIVNTYIRIRSDLRVN